MLHYFQKYIWLKTSLKCSQEFRVIDSSLAANIVSSDKCDEFLFNQVESTLQQNVSEFLNRNVSTLRRVNFCQSICKSIQGSFSHCNVSQLVVDKVKI